MKRLTEKQFLSLNELPQRYAKVIVRGLEVEFPCHFVIFEEGDDIEKIGHGGIADFVRQDSHYQFNDSTVEILIQKQSNH